MASLKNLDVKKSKEMLNSLSYRAWHWLQQLPYTLFVRRSHALDIAAVVIMLGVIAYLSAVLLYLPVPGVDLSPPEQQDLNLDAIDRIEFWIEELDGERQRQIRLPEAEIFTP